MVLSKLKHYGRRCVELGPQKSFSILENRLRTAMFEKYWRHKALKGQAGISWKEFVKKNQCTNDFTLFFNQIKKNEFTFLSQLYEQEPLNENDVVKQAELFADNCFDLLGSGMTCFEQMPWHIDFRLQKQNTNADCAFPSKAYYKDIKIRSGKTEQPTKDIKVPWELSRFEHLYVLGKAYQIKNDEKYAQVFVNQIEDWWEHNPFLLGTNWVCPMDVGIRAVNWIWAFHFFKDAQTVPSSFWQRFVCSLYDHSFYLENNWEIFDSITSNHYLSDLLGYFYVCSFFQHVPSFSDKKMWCYREFLKEFEKQIFDEGTDYEGSTCYHRLVTEIFYHFYLLCQENQLSVPKNFVEKLTRMFAFIDWCTPTNGKLVQIGDNDSGTILFYGLQKSVSGLTNSNAEQKGKALVGQHEAETAIQHYQQFGLSIIKTNVWHSTLRHHAYKKDQVTGHFHSDVGSITLAVDGISIFVDPGSYLYTPSEVWRNQFRSVAAHNSFYLEQLEPLSIDDRLFYLDLPESSYDNVVSSKFSSILLTTEHSLYSAVGLTAKRTVLLEQGNSSMTITDAWYALDNSRDSYPKSTWNFTLSPDVDVVSDGNSWVIAYQGKPKVSVDSTDLRFELSETWVSSAYGSKHRAKRLRASAPTILNKEVKIFVHRI